MTTTFMHTVPVLMVEDLEVAMKFYTERLGFKVSFISEWEYNGVSRDGLELHIGKGNPNTFANQAANIYFMVKGIDALHEEFVRSGAISPETAVIDQPYGAREIHLYDPFGYHLGFSEMKES